MFEPAPSAAPRPRRAVVVLPQWNADTEGHVGLCRLFARFGLTAVRLSLPYHDERRPAELARAEFIVSSNIGRTLHANRQAVLDAKRVVDWLSATGLRAHRHHGHEPGIMPVDADDGARPPDHAPARSITCRRSSPTSCGAGCRRATCGPDSTAHITLDDLRECWLPISPWPFIPAVRGRNVLLVYARYDRRFRWICRGSSSAEFDRQGIAYERAVLPCGHYTTGKAPFKLRRRLPPDAVLREASVAVGGGGSVSAIVMKPQLLCGGGAAPLVAAA